MSDQVDYWRDVKEAQRKFNQLRLEATVKLLKDRKVAYTEHNFGTHLILLVGKKPVADLWPSTGRWHVREGGRYGNDVEHLLYQLKL